MDVKETFRNLFFLQPLSFMSDQKESLFQRDLPRSPATFIIIGLVALGLGYLGALLFL